MNRVRGVGRASPHDRVGGIQGVMNGREGTVSVSEQGNEGADDCWCWLCSEACTKDAIPGRVMQLLEVGEPPNDEDVDDDDAEEEMEDEETEEVQGVCMALDPN